MYICTYETLCVTKWIEIGVYIVKTTFSSAIFALYMVGVVLGTLYSVPPIQLKRFPLLGMDLLCMYVCIYVCVCLCMHIQMEVLMP